ncbi:MAG: SufD family Fe-S cluster assembly protein [Anaerolineaceae bacterium]|nr:SufD family Fe-S cluster assembly protein [Anaerolineaceae bacterium]
MGKAAIKELSSQKKVIKNLSEVSGQSFSNMDIALIRGKILNDFISNDYEKLVDIFGRKYKDLLGEVQELVIPVDPPKIERVLIDPGDFQGMKILGKISVIENTLRVWTDPKLEKQGVIFTDLWTAINKYSGKVLEFLSKDEVTRNGPISKLAIGLSKIGTFLYIPDHIILNGIFIFEYDFYQSKKLLPIHLISLLEEHTSANLFVHFKSGKINKNISVLVNQTDCFINKNSQLNVFQRQSINHKIALFSDELIHMEKRAKVNFYTLDQGSLITDRIFSTELNGEGANAEISGVYTPKNKQHFFYDTKQIHNASYTNSDLLFKGVVGKNSFAKWKGNIVVTKETKGTDGYQANKTLLIEKSARVESIPGLEIITDDVKCSHSVTIGDIDKNQMFYLQSRGIKKEDAEKLIVDGFLRSTIKRVPNSGFKELLSAYLNA